MLLVSAPLFFHLQARLRVMVWPLLMFKVLACGLRCAVYAPAPYGVAQGSMGAMGLGCAGRAAGPTIMLLQGILLGWVRCSL